MQTHGNLAASSLWQPSELARRMLGERPSPVPPTRELWPPPEPILSISTLQLAYQQNEDISPRHAFTLPSQPYGPTTVPIGCDASPRLCTVGTNTDPPPTVLSRIRDFLRRDNDLISSPSPIQLSVMKMDQNKESSSHRTVNGIKKAISGAKYRVNPNSESIASPKIVYDTSKPGDRMVATFGANNSRKWLRLPSRSECSRRFRTLKTFCCQRSPDPSHRQCHRPPLQITQV
ncbi:uncharacterized protein LOC124534060 [Vanessa cardui]|uniref:uncharacterized protein LOC124534060 n=1 Tax=Vanessa cardui TaxID=171605 RepID=UPI001F129B96|nr:uncharacterized protein LOC124534060 [Vanessa cardui]